MDNILKAQGFELELGGGGCTLLSRYFDGAGYVWATCDDGGGLPTRDDWLVCAYGDDIEEILFTARHGNGKTLLEAIEQATAIARDFVSSVALCRNGKPLAECQCC